VNRRVVVRRLLVAGLVVLVVLELAYLVAGNLLLATDWGRDLVNRKPERVAVQWDGGWTAWPGTVHLDGLKLRGQSRSVQWAATAERASGSISLLGLLAREFRADDIRASGVTFLLRRRQDREWKNHPPPPVELQPEIPGLENPPLDPPSRPDRAPEDAWELGLEFDRLTDVREIWVDQVRYLGPAEASGGFEIFLKRTIEVLPSRLELAGGRLELAGEEVAREITGVLTAESDRYSHPENKGTAALAFYRFGAEGSGEVGDVAGLVPDGQALELERLAGRLAVDGSFVQGRLAPGTRIAVEPAAVSLRLLDDRAEGSGRVEATVADGGWEATGVLEEFSITRLGADAPHVTGEQLTAELAGASAELGELLDRVHLTLDLPPATLADLTVYDDVLPAAADLRILGGRGTLSGHFEAELRRPPEVSGTSETPTAAGDSEVSGTSAEVSGTSASASASGSLRLTSQGLAARFGDVSLAGDLTVDAVFPTLDLAGREYRLDGTTVTIDRGRLGGEVAGDDRPWNGRVRVIYGALTPGGGTLVDANLDGRFSDTRPLLALYASRRDLPDWLERVLTEDDLEVSGRVAAGSDAVRLREMEITAEDLEILGDLALSGPGQRRGRLYLAFGRLDLGVELTPAGRDLHLLRAKKWFEEGR
jgi:hypothetical protein